MPILKRRKELLAFVAISLVLSCSRAVFAQTSVVDLMALRATGAVLSADVVRAIADASAPTQLTPGDYPEAGGFTPRQIAQVLCGSPPESYLALLRDNNKLTAPELDQKLGDRIYSIQFPKCLYYLKLLPGSWSYKVKLGDTYSTIRQKFTGVQGDTSSLAHYFQQPPDRVAKGELFAGENLQIPYYTASAVLPAPDATATYAAIANEAGPDANQLAVSLQPELGQIVSFVHGQNGTASTPETPAECGTAIGHPFPAADVADAFQFSFDRAKNIANVSTPFPVETMVVDNGFFGARPSAAGPIFRDPEFGKRFFNTLLYPANLGPTTGVPPDRIYPINYQNGLTPSGALAGHGTHVTGLVLGGPDFLNYRNMVFTNGSAWLKVSELNVGRGTDQLVAGSDQQIGTKLALQSTPRIVNLSISYSDNASSNFGFMDPGNPQYSGAQHLYVVAAGNDNRRNVAKYYPAALGGVVRSPSVITVSAIDANGALTQFTNIGPTDADVAAPGCNIESWVDDSSPPVPLSGTSQAAPIVAFEAALIRGLTNAGARDLKNRIVASGDLLSPNDRGLLSGHVKVNLVNALYVYDDYVEYLPDGATVLRRVLGKVLNVDGLACGDSQDGIGVDTLAAYKRDGTDMYGYWTDASNRMNICSLSPLAANSTVTMKLSADISNNYQADVQQITIPLSSVKNIVMRMHLAQ